MPFVQRVVQPTFLSRSNGNCINDRTIKTITRAGAVVRQKSGQLCDTKATTKALIQFTTCAEIDPEPPVKKQILPTCEDYSSNLKTSANCCCSPRKQHCCNGIAASNNKITTTNNGLIGSCCNAKANSLSSFSYSTADIDIDAVDNEIDSSEPTISDSHTRCRGVLLDRGGVSDQPKEFQASSKSGYNYSGDYCYSSYNDGSIGLQANGAHGDSGDVATVAPTIVTGYELESISNITFSNALRQLASLVVIASDIFHYLNKELQNVGDRTRDIRAKIDSLDRRVSVFDPKLVTVPESCLGTFAHRKTHYLCDKSYRKALFTSETRPTSVKVLYEEAANISHCWLLPSRNETADSCTYAADELDLGKAHHKMRTKIDTEIEIRLPAGIEDLRKWTSSEALGDVTVTPDCINRVDGPISTSVVIGDNGVLTPVLSPSMLSADAVDALYSITNSNNILHISNEISKDVPLNHRLPSPEEQCKLLASKYPAELISVDTSGKRFERMCLARKSTTGCALGMSEVNNLNVDVQTVSRRSRSRKVRGKRRNTISGTDQKEIEDAANGMDSHDTIDNSLAAAGANMGKTDINDNTEKQNSKFSRSKSNDILKKDSVALPYDKGKNTLTRLNSLKLWGRNRLKFIAPSGGKSSNKSLPKPVAQSRLSVVEGSGDIDDKCTVSELTKKKSELFEMESRFSHERKPSYSSSEKSVSFVSNDGKSQKVPRTAVVGSSNVKLRDTSSLNRQRRNGINGHIKDEPHSSSGNWSASSESGRTSIGSEITIQPKSSASNTSLNVSSFHPGSGPPSSIISRRRFLNTSASSSVTSEDTATPDLQIGDDDETSSAYSCDTEGYYTSFHIDSGLRTLKEEEPVSPIQTSSTHPSNHSFGSISNQTILTAENEYELFGKGSTSTTTSSAGTVCTTLLVNEHGPDVPERISSLSKLSNGINSASSSTLERSYSSSTMGSTLERTGTIKRNSVAVSKAIGFYDEKSNTTTDSSPASQENEFTFETHIATRSAQPLPSITNSEIEYSESSDLEGVERIERIKQKTAMTAKRIPSMCIITPNTSDDENIKESSEKSVIDHNREYTAYYVNPCATTEVIGAKKDHNLNHLKSTLQNPLHNVLDRIKVVLPMKKKSPDKEDKIYDAVGEYVAIADNGCNQKHTKSTTATKAGGLGIYYSNDIVRRNLNTEPTGSIKQKTEYISMNELPCNIRRSQASNVAHPFAVDTEKIDSQCAASGVVDQTTAEVAAVASPQCGTCENENTTALTSSSLPEKTINKGARVKMNSQGKIIYDSDSLKRCKGAHTTFAPGPYVKETESTLPLQVTSDVDPPQVGESTPKAESKLPQNLSANKGDLFLINGGCVKRKVINVRPVVPHRAPTIVNMTAKSHDRPPKQLPQAMPLIAPSSPQSLSSNSTNLISTSSSTSLTSSTASTSTVLDEGYHRFSKGGTQEANIKPTIASYPLDGSAAGLYNAPIYWTLQNRRQTNPEEPAITSRDDLYATPLSRANRNAVTKNNAQSQSRIYKSPIAPKTRSNFFTSTPNKAYQNLQTKTSVGNTPAIQPIAKTLQKGDENNPERSYTCFDRIGTSKTSLMDFKKLLLAKSAKTAPVQKLSAVELLKMNKSAAEKEGSVANADQKINISQSLNSPMALLELSRSPKTFANRRMLRQGQFGSPSKSFTPKHRSAQWRINTMRTDVISTTIPEANSEEDPSNSSGESNHSGSKPSSEQGNVATYDRNEHISEDKFDLKRNIFLQTEENNFMKGELRSSFIASNVPEAARQVKNAPKTFLKTSPQACAVTANRNYGANGFNLNSNNNVAGMFTTPQNSFIATNENENIFPALETAL